MEPEMAEKIEKMRQKLDSMGVDWVQPTNPYCARAVLLGTRAEPDVVLDFWRGEPESVEFFRHDYPLKKLSRLADALQQAARIVDQFPV
ncbi:MAG: hypothetical protein R6V05_12510 [Candidatus Brocadiia bacterium]